MKRSVKIAGTLTLGLALLAAGGCSEQTMGPTTDGMDFEASWPAALHEDGGRAVAGYEDEIGRSVEQRRKSLVE